MYNTVYPFRQEYPITSNWQHHKNTGGERAKYAGTDFGTPVGVDILAPQDGTCSSHVDHHGGKYALLVNSEFLWILLHLSEVTKIGNVRAGEKIGLTGNTGWTTGPHTHIELRKNGVNIDPEPYLLNAKKKMIEKYEQEIRELKARISGLELKYKTDLATANSAKTVLQKTVENQETSLSQQKSRYEELLKDKEEVLNQVSKLENRKLGLELDLAETKLSLKRYNNIVYVSIQYFNLLSRTIKYGIRRAIQKSKISFKPSVYFRYYRKYAIEIFERSRARFNFSNLFDILRSRRNG